MTERQCRTVDRVDLRRLGGEDRRGGRDERVAHGGWQQPDLINNNPR